MEFVDVGNVAEIQAGQAKIVEVNGEPVAVFNVEGKFYAINNTCIHRGGPLGEGSLDGEVVTCPWHGWQYNVKTGVSPVNPTAKVKIYKTKVENGKVFVAKE